MIKRTLVGLLIALLASACGSGDTTGDTVAGQAEPLTMEQYLVAVVNTDADSAACERLAEEEVNIEYDAEAGVAEADEEAHFRERIVRRQDCLQAGVDELAALAPPAEAVGAHDAFVGARAAYLSEWRAMVAAAGPGDFEHNFELSFGPMGATLDAYIDAVCTLQGLATSEGFEVDLHCPTVEGEAIEAPLVTVVLEDEGWSVEPSAVVEDPGTGIELAVENRTDREWFIGFVDVFAGSADDLPIVDGVIDVSRCNQIFGDDPDPSPANIGCPSATGEGEHEAEQVFPGQTHFLDAGIPTGTHVVLDFSPGGYEAGNWIVVESFGEE